VIERPQFRAHLAIETVKGEGVFVLSEAAHAVLDGRLFERVVPLIDGRRSTDEIADALEADLPPAQVYYAIKLLEQRGLIHEGTERSPRDAAFWALHDLPPDVAAERLARANVSIRSFGDIAIDGLVQALAAMHVRVCDDGDIDIVVVSDYLCAALEAYNREALRTGRRWMLVKPVGHTILVGPAFHPGRSGCWSCMAQRLRMNRSVEMFVQRKLDRREPLLVAAATTAATRQVASGLAATEVARWIVRGDAVAADSGVLSLDVMTWRTQRHPFTRQPHCAACGAPVPASELGKEIVLESRRKSLFQVGEHRAVAPEETVRNFERHVSPLTGAVSALQRYVASSDTAMHVYLAGENHAAPYSSLRHIQWSLRSRSSGKGTTDAQAKASALCEALERHSGVFQGTEPRRTATYAKLDGLAIHPNACMLFSKRQFERRADINAEGSRFSYVPLPFDEDADIEWSPVWSMTHRTFRYLPTEYCYYDYPAPEGRRYSVGCSNGNAAGNTTEEAILHGFLELVERDAVALWWYPRARRPGVDLDSFDEPYVHDLRAFLKARHRDVWVLDLTTDLEMPTFVAVSRRTNHLHEHIMVGFGTHLDPCSALLRALTELTQSLTWVLGPTNDGAERIEALQDDELQRWLTTATLANQPYLTPASDAPLRTASDYRAQWNDDLKDDVLLCQNLVTQRGMEMLVLDQTRPDIGLPVVKVMVPGLRHFWPRFAPGRLYDVPPSLGWVREPVVENRLNPVSMFI
jgi:ribosomal protein S12 methylthiotransferase accessory factor